MLLHHVPIASFAALANGIVQCLHAVLLEWCPACRVDSPDAHSRDTLCIGFEGIADQLPKFDIDKHGNRLDKPLDPYGEVVPYSLTAQYASCISCC